MNKIKCSKCNKEIDADSVFCEYCGSRIGKKEKKKFNWGFVKKQRKKFLIVIIAVFLIFLIYTFKPGKFVPININMKFSYYPGNYSKAFIFGVSYDENFNYTNFEKFLFLVKKYEMPITIFIKPFDLDINNYEQFLGKDIELDLTELLDIIGKYEMGYDIELLAYDLPYNAIDYNEQEKLFKKSKRLIKDVTGIFINSRYDYDTLLAVENSNLDFVLLNINEQFEPFHPISPLNEKMNLLIFPINQGLMDEDKGFLIYLIDINNINILQIEDFFKRIKQDDIWIITAKKANEYIRLVNKMSARITTDFKKFHSSLELMMIANNTKIEFNTVLKPVKIKSDNSSIEWTERDNGFYIVVDEENKKLKIDWEEVKD